MRRMTTDRPASEMNMAELAHNCMYARDGWAWYRDYERDMDLRDFIREFSIAEGAGELTEDNEIQAELLMDNLQYWIDCPSGRVALVYRIMWAMADLRETLMAYEDICPDPVRLREIDALYLDKCREVMALKEQHRWIPMEERPPEEDADYLVTMVTPGFLNGQPYTNWLCWCCDDQEWTDTDGAAMPEQDKVVAWRPILAPYKPETMREAGQEAGDGGLTSAT